MRGIGVVLLVTLAFSQIRAQPFQPDQGNLLTTDRGGPYDLSQLSVQENEVKGAQAARRDYTDRDILDFLVNVECLEGLFDTWGVFNRGFRDGLDGGAPKPRGARAANLSERYTPFLQEVALNEQGHALLTRQAGSTLPCPQLDFDRGFNELLAFAYGLAPGAESIKHKFGKPFDPFLNDEHFILAMLTLEELGATGNKGLILMYSNPVLANAQAGLATSATAQAAIERKMLWELRDRTIEPFGECAQTVFARISAARDALDGAPLNDQGLINTDPRFIAVPSKHVNMIPTDVRGLTFCRSPQQVINILTVGSPDGKGGFFPDGMVGRVGQAGPAGFEALAEGTETWPLLKKTANQMKKDQIGDQLPPITVEGPYKIPGEELLTQDQSGPLDNGTYITRGGEFPEATLSFMVQASWPTKVWA